MFLISRTIHKALWERVALESPPLYACTWKTHVSGVHFWLAGSVSGRSTERKKKGKPVTLNGASQWTAHWPCHSSGERERVRSWLSWKGHTRQRCDLFPSWAPGDVRSCPMGSCTSKCKLEERRTFLTQGAGPAGCPNLCTICKKKPPYLSEEEKDKGVPS